LRNLRCCDPRGACHRACTVAEVLGRSKSRNRLSEIHDLDLLLGRYFLRLQAPDPRDGMKTVPKNVRSDVWLWVSLILLSLLLLGLSAAVT